MKMNNILKNLSLLLLLPLLSLVAIGCVEDDEYVDVHPRIAQVAPVRGKPGTEVVITGRNLAEVSTVLFGGVEAEITSKSAESVTVIVPEDAVVGNQQLRVASPKGVTVKAFEVQGGLELPEYTIFNEQLNDTWQVWGGWGGVSSDVNNSEFPLEGGVKNLKISWADAWGGFQLHPTQPDPFTLANYANVMVYIRGGAGMAGRKVYLFIKDKAGVEHAKKEIVLEEEYVMYKIPLSELGSPANINELNFQNAEAGTVIYVDGYGLN